MRLNNKNSRALGELVKKATDTEYFLKAVLDNDIVLSVDPATLGSSAGTINEGDFTRTVICSVVDSDGKVIEYFNGTLPVAVAVVTNGDGDASIGGTDLTFVNGVANVVITYTGTWAEADTCTLTLGSTSSIAGISVADKTSVDTVIA